MGRHNGKRSGRHAPHHRGVTDRPLRSFVLAYPFGAADERSLGEMLHIAQEEAADALLSRDPFALLMGMLLDQQFPMERAFAGPYILTQRMGQGLDPQVIASYDPRALADLFSRPPAIHRYPASMAARVQELARYV